MHEPQLEERRTAPTLLSTNFLSLSNFPNSLSTQLLIHPHSFPLSLLSCLDKKHSNPLRFFILKFKLRSSKQNFFRIGNGGISFLEAFAGSSHDRSKPLLLAARRKPTRFQSHILAIGALLEPFLNQSSRFSNLPITFVKPCSRNPTSWRSSFVSIVGGFGI